MIVGFVSSYIIRIIDIFFPFLSDDGMSRKNRIIYIYIYIYIYIITLKT